MILNDRDNGFTVEDRRRTDKIAVAPAAPETHQVPY